MKRKIEKLFVELDPALHSLHVDEVPGNCGAKETLVGGQCGCDVGDEADLVGKRII